MQLTTPLVGAVFSIGAILSSCSGDIGTDSDQGFADSDASVGATTAAMVTGPDDACITERVGGNPPCTANDVRVGSMELVGADVTCAAGEELTVTIEATIESGPDRYDIGLWVNESGGSALSDPDGTCYRDYLPPPLSATTCDQAGGPYFNGEVGEVGDTCGDVYAQNTTPCGAIPVCDFVNGPTSNCTASCTGGGGTCLFTTRQFMVDIVCTDSDMDGMVDAGTCTSWDNQVDDNCTSALGTDPGTGSKCSCDSINIGGLFFGCMADSDCDDGVACTDDVCTIDGNMGTCSNTPNDGLCPGSDQCNDAVCDPMNDCQLVSKADSTPCEDGDACTSETGTEASPDHCAGGICVGVPVGCGPGDDCNNDVCNPANGTCEFVPVADSTPCEDGMYCTSETGEPGTPDHCESGECVGVPLDCGPGDQCNDRVCNEDTDVCEVVPKPISTPCEDGNACTSQTGTEASPDHCAGGICVGVPVGCGPGDQCNDDVCDPATGTCEFVPKPISTPCEDGDACTSETGTEASPDHCAGGICVGVPVGCGPGDDCNNDVCNPANGTCEFVPVADSTPCEDGDACTSETGTEASPDHCFGGACTGIPVGCGPGDNCNNDVCNPANGTCEFVPVADSTPCEDGDACTSETGTEASPDHCFGGACTGVPVGCGPGDDCNNDVCNPANGTCEFVPVTDSTPCEDGDACTSETGTEASPDHCFGGACTGIPVGCGPGDNCNTDVCNPANGTCEFVPKADSTPCQDGDFCTSETGTQQTPDHCESGVCVGIDVDCGDDNDCTVDVCDDVDGACDNTFNSDICPATCRTAGFWAQRGGGDNNYTQAVIDANDSCLNVCGVDICGTVGELGTLGSALEAECTKMNNSTILDQTYRQMVAAALNCVLTGAGDHCGALLDPILVGVDWAQCNDACANGAADPENPDNATLSTCEQQIDCWNNGLVVVETNDGWGCAVGTCSYNSVDCGGDFGPCAQNECSDYHCTLTSDSCDGYNPCPPVDNECIPTSGCHDRELCDSQIVEYLEDAHLTCDPESVGAATGGSACRTAQRNDCLLSSQDGCAPNECVGMCNP